MSFIEIALSGAFEVINLGGFVVGGLLPSKGVSHFGSVDYFLDFAGDRSRQVFKCFQVKAHLLLLLKLRAQHSCLQLLILHIVCVLAGISLFLEVVETGAYRLFVHGDALFEDVQSAGDDVQLGYDFLKGQSKFFARASHSAARSSSCILRQKLLVSIILSQFCRTFSLFQFRSGTLVAGRVTAISGRSGLGGLSSRGGGACVLKARHFVELFSFNFVEM